MTKKNKKGGDAKPDTDRLNDRLRAAEAASGIGAFELTPAEKQWRWSPEVAVLFGLDPQSAPADFDAWLQGVFPDDAVKICSAVATAQLTGSFYVEFRVKRPDGRLHWLAGKGQLAREGGFPAPRSCAGPTMTSMNVSSWKRGCCR